MIVIIMISDCCGLRAKKQIEATVFRGRSDIYIMLKFG